MKLETPPDQTMKEKPALQPEMRRHPKPQRVWKWEIAIYLYLAGMGAGSYIIGTLVNWFVDPANPVTILGLPIDLAKAAILWGPILVSIGAPFLILDLGIKKRFLFACLNPKTSWVARGFLILSAFIVFGLAAFAIHVLPSHWFKQGIAVLPILEFAGFILAFGTALYTGVLLKSVRYVAMWNTFWLPLLFLVSALSTGSMSIILSTLGYRVLISEGEFSGQLLRYLTGAEQILILIEGLVLGLYLYCRYQARDQGEQGENSIRLLLKGELSPLFWGGIIVIGFVFPIVLEYVYSHFPEHPILLWVTGLFLLTGGFFLRLGVLAAGIKDQVPMQRFIEIKMRS